MGIGFGHRDEEEYPLSFWGKLLQVFLTPAIKFIGEQNVFRIRYWRDQFKTVSPKLRQLHWLWDYRFECKNCAKSFLLGDCKLVPIEEPSGRTRTALVTCNECGCVADYDPFFNFETGVMEGGTSRRSTNYGMELPK